MRTSGLSKNCIQYFLTNNRRKSASRKIQFWPFSSVTTRMLLAAGRFSQLLLYREEGGTSQLLVAWSSFGRLCRLSIASVAKRLVQSPCHSKTLNISAEAEPIHISPFMSAVACANQSLLALHFRLFQRRLRGESAGQLPGAPAYRPALRRHWDNRKCGAGKLRSPENGPKFEHARSKRYVGPVLGRKCL